MNSEKIKMRLGYNFNRFVIKVIKTAIASKLIKLNHAQIEYHKPKTNKFIVISNHTDAIDPGYITVALGRYIRFVAGDHTIRQKKGWMYKYLAGVIIKHRELPTSVLIDEIKKNISYGIPVGLFAEGAITVNGQTCFLSENTGRLLKESGASLITYRIVGGYLKKPRWAPHSRRGPVKADFVNEYSPEELAKLTDKEVADIIRRDIYVNIFDEQRKNPQIYEGENLAESVERVLYICPKCKKMCMLKSSGDFLTCESCGYKLRFGTDGFFHDCGTGVIFYNTLDWDMWQRQELKQRLASAQPGSLIFCDKHQSVSKITDTTKLEMLSRDAVLSLYTDRLSVEMNNGRPPLEFKLSEINQLTFSGKDAVLIIENGNVYDIRCSVPRSSIKYMAAWRYLTGKEYK